MVIVAFLPLDVVTVIFALPFFFAVTTPSLETFATFLSLLFHFSLPACAPSGDSTAFSCSSSPTFSVTLFPSAIVTFLTALGSATFTFSDKVSAIRMTNLEPGIIFEVEIQRSDETTPHVLHMEDNDTYIQRFRILDSTMSTGTLEDCQLINCTGQNQQTSYSATGSVGVVNFSPDVYAASAYGGQSQTFTYTGSVWKDEANNTVVLEDIGHETESEDPGDTIEVTVSDVYTKIITLQDLRDLGLIP